MRAYQWLPSVLGVLSFASASAVPSPDFAVLTPRQEPTWTCTNGVQVMAAPGEGVPMGSLSLMGTLVGNITAAIPNSYWTQVPIPIPSNSSEGVYITSVGAMHLRHYIREYHRACPDSKIVLAGYSAGAVVTMNTLCGQQAPYTPRDPYPAHYLKNIIASIAYGDETRTTGASYDLGTCTTGYGTHPRPEPQLCDTYAPIMQSYCDAPDPLCCQPYGNNITAHFQYGPHYDYVATQFVVQQWQKSQQPPTKPPSKHQRKHHRKHHRKPHHQN